MSLLLLTFSIALLASLLLTRGVRTLARSWNFVDCPDGVRKIHAAPIALGGGVAMYGAVAIALTVLALTRDTWDWEKIQANYLLSDYNAPALNFYQIFVLMIAGGVLCVVGLYDDLFQMRGRTKLALQILASAIIVYFPGEGGLYLHRITLFGETYPLGNLGPLLTMIWLIVSINSFNLIDGVDGLAGTLGTIFCVAFGVMALMMGNTVDGIVAFVLAGAILGFLRYNSNPATIYMGDAGSMFIGLVMGTLAVRSSIKGQAVSIFAAPLAVWAIPILDSSMAVLRRKLTGRSIYATDRGHIHHRLLTRGMSPRQAVAVIGGLSAITSVAAVLSLYFRNEWIGLAGIVIVFGILVATRMFGHVELLLLNSKLVGVGKTLLAWGMPRPSNQSTHRLQGNLQWEQKIWSALVEAAERHGLTNLRLNLYLPKLHEDFHAVWKSSSLVRTTGQDCRTQIPLVVDGVVIGGLEVAGRRHEGLSASEQLTEFVELLLEPLEAELKTLLAVARPVDTSVASEDDSVTPAEIVTPAATP
ncbi:MAG: MraY family glycosyltransferase [Pirellulales bacterium]